jgi:hypothetical protein
MKPADKIKELINKSDVATGPQTNKRILGDALEHLEKIKQPGIWSTIISPIGKLAVAAVVLLAIALPVILRNPDGPRDSDKVPSSTQSPADMRSILALNIAYRRGGMEAVDRQCRRAMEMLGPRPAEATIEEILMEFNGT